MFFRRLEANNTDLELIEMLQVVIHVFRCAPRCASLIGQITSSRKSPGNLINTIIWVSFTSNVCLLIPLGIL